MLAVTDAPEPEPLILPFASSFPGLMSSGVLLPTLRTTVDGNGDGRFPRRQMKQSNPDVGPVPGSVLQLVPPVEY